MKGNLRKTAAALLSLTVLFSSGCAGEQKTEEVKNINTSSGMDIYAAETEDGEYKAVDGKGNDLTHYSVDEDGNIKEGDRIVIGRENVKEYIFIKAILPLNQTGTGEIELPVRIVPGTVNEFQSIPATVEYRFYVSPSNCSNPVLLVSTSDEKTAALSDAYGERSETEITAIDGIASFYVRCLKQGNAVISVKTVDGSNLKSEMTVTVTEQQCTDRETAQSSEDEIQTTESSKGWISTRNVRFRSKPSSDDDILDIFSSGTEVTILGSDGNGWTKCSFSGTEGYVKSEYVTRIKPESQQNSQVQSPVLSSSAAPSSPLPSEMPVRANDGNDHGNAYGMQTENKLKSAVAASEAVNHTHYYVKAEEVPSSGKEAGYTVYRCDCGKSYRVKRGG